MLIFGVTGQQWSWAILIQNNTPAWPVRHFSNWPDDVLAANPAGSRGIALGSNWPDELGVDMPLGALWFVTSPSYCPDDVGLFSDLYFIAYPPLDRNFPTVNVK